MKAIKFLVLSVLILSGCSGDILESQIKEVNLGTYQLKGMQIENQLCYICSVGEEGHVMSADTTEIEFTVEIEYPKGVLASGKADTVHFRGLEGADAGEHTLAFRYCTPPFCYTVARLSGSELTLILLPPAVIMVATDILVRESWSWKLNINTGASVLSIFWREKRLMKNDL